MTERDEELAEQAEAFADRDFKGEINWSEAYESKLIELVRADERRRITNLMLYMHNKASLYHNYYKHAAVEINRKDGEGEKI
jgi:hypothetical protein